MMWDFNSPQDTISKLYCIIFKSFVNVWLKTSLLLLKYRTFYFCCNSMEFWNQSLGNIITRIVYKSFNKCFYMKKLVHWKSKVRNFFSILFLQLKFLKRFKIHLNVVLRLLEKLEFFQNKLIFILQNKWIYG